LAGVSRQQHTTELKLIRVACSGRVDLAFVQRAFARGADGVFIGGCWPGDCHYVTQGNYDALSGVHLYRKLLRRIGLRPERLRLEWIAASEGARYAEAVNDFVAQLGALGPLGEGEELGLSAAPPSVRGPELAAPVLARRLEAVGKLLPYLKLVERERLRAPVRTQQAIDAFYASEEMERLFDELFADKLAVSQILSLLAREPLSTAEIAQVLELSPSEVSRHMTSSSRQGLVQYDASRQRYALARA
jgi:coenzyme F420-reducing hydrogenase delta subunit/biotin operon repressor